MAKGRKESNQVSSESPSGRDLRCSDCGSRINDYGGCDGCGRALDAEELAQNVAPSDGDGDGGSGFAV